MSKIFCDIKKCLGCRSCEIACAVEHSKTKSLFGAVFEDDIPVHRVKVEHAVVEPIPVRCQHCKDAKCVIACMSGAMSKDEKGSTKHDKDKCVGCWMCIMVCPFGAIKKQDKIVVKCDLCPEKDGKYACVEACPTKALFAVEAVEASEVSATKGKISKSIR